MVGNPNESSGIRATYDDLNKAYCRLGMPNQPYLQIGHSRCDSVRGQKGLEEIDDMPDVKQNTVTVGDFIPNICAACLGLAK